MKAFGPICSPGKTSNCNFVTFQLRAVFFCATPYTRLEKRLFVMASSGQRFGSDRQTSSGQQKIGGGLCRKDAEKRPSDAQRRPFLLAFFFSLLPHRFPADVQNKKSHILFGQLLSQYKLWWLSPQILTETFLSREKGYVYRFSQIHPHIVFCFHRFLPPPQYSTFVAATPLAQNAHVVWRLKGKLKRLFCRRPSFRSSRVFLSILLGGWGSLAGSMQKKGNKNAKRKKKTFPPN